MCGGASAGYIFQARHCGLSPRVRGSLSGKSSGGVWYRSIPACAGEPPPSSATQHHPEVYPRVCGGAAASMPLRRDSNGLSPRVRGSHISIRRHRSTHRSIPACAGEPRRGRDRRAATWVYPRVCGGATRTRLVGWPGPGLSPRVRGSLLTPVEASSSLRSIPACAGEPMRLFGSLGGAWVYPRVCGGAPPASSVGIVEMGLSPRVRGSRDERRDSIDDPRSIPACAGEPESSAPRSDPPSVYPRVCGGADQRSSPLVEETGLSPRVRGSHRTKTQRGSPIRSIPACAGEPPRKSARALVRTVYPRVCGGAAVWPPDTCSAQGLSPRVRGSPTGNVPAAVTMRSIPACAGEPTVPAKYGQPARVYPRVCGGANCPDTLPPRVVGLSPRVRGSRREGRAGYRASRSIPACAGEPPRPLE